LNHSAFERLFQIFIDFHLMNMWSCRFYIHQEFSAELSTEPGKLHPLKCDVTKENDVVSSFAWVKENLGGVDILINNAGIFNEILLQGMYHIYTLTGNVSFLAWRRLLWQWKFYCIRVWLFLDIFVFDMETFTPERLVFCMNIIWSVTPLERRRENYKTVSSSHQKQLRMLSIMLHSHS
jgi:hypothetical protein